MPADVGQLLAPAEAAENLQLNKFTLARWRTEGTGPAYIRVGRHIRYRASDLAAWLDAQTVHGSPT